MDASRLVLALPLVMLALAGCTLPQGDLASQLPAAPTPGDVFVLQDTTRRADITLTFDTIIMLHGEQVYAFAQDGHWGYLGGFDRIRVHDGARGPAVEDADARDFQPFMAWDAGPPVRDAGHHGNTEWTVHVFDDGVGRTVKLEPTSAGDDAKTTYHVRYAYGDLFPETIHVFEAAWDSEVVDWGTPQVVGALKRTMPPVP